MTTFHSPPNLKKTPAAFTLIEFLVVIAIIAIMAAILFPVLARARENARRSSCQSNLKQIGLGLLQYVQDYDERMPFSAYGPDNAAAAATVSDPINYYKWMDTIQPYVKSEQIFNCPSDALSPPYKFRDGNNYGSYAQNGAYGGAPTDNQTPPRSSIARLISLAEIANSAQTVWATDSNNSGDVANGGDSGGSYGFFWVNAASNPTIQTFGGVRQLSQIRERHLETTNVLFCDGHVKALKLDTLAQTKAVGGAQVMTLFTIEDD